MSRPPERPVSAGVSDGMAREAGLGIGLGLDGAAEHVGHGALAGPGAPQYRDVQWRRRLAIEERPNAIADQRRRQAQLDRMRRLAGLLPAILLQPAEVLGQLARQGTKLVHGQ